MKSVLLLASQNRLLPIFSTPPARNDREAIPPELSSSDSKFRTGKFLFFSVLKYRILVKCTTFTAIHGPSHSGRSPKNTPVKRVNTYVKCMCQQGLQFFLSTFLSETRFFAPLTGTYPYDPNNRDRNGPHQEQKAKSNYFTNRPVNFRVSPGHFKL